MLRRWSKRPTHRSQPSANWNSLCRFGSCSRRLSDVPCSTPKISSQSNFQLIELIEYLSQNLRLQNFYQIYPRNCSEYPKSSSWLWRWTHDPGRIVIAWVVTGRHCRHGHRHVNGRNRHHVPFVFIFVLFTGPESGETAETKRRDFASCGSSWNTSHRFISQSTSLPQGLCQGES